MLILNQLTIKNLNCVHFLIPSLKKMKTKDKEKIEIIKTNKKIIDNFNLIYKTFSKYSLESTKMVLMKLY